VAAINRYQKFLTINVQFLTITGNRQINR